MIIISMSYQAIPVLFRGYRVVYALIANFGRITCCHFGHEILSYSPCRMKYVDRTET